ncbi:YbaK/EbsC family protein [Treponema putidum]|uniref:YbaK/EbsC family protein n=1 Tax=Treponema putidum TaxID=221027 RepID=A0ABY5HRL7_9SPIR|nr:YbaK/EbsC family protein [Treponema putidum]UTY28092.1 YbaK/EbsC family protein [Treponema putidum]UTY30591.1 YbaK/EbsC family protein [Treponema putidum]
MGLKEAREHLKLFSLEDRIIEFDKSSATVDLAAAALGCKPEFIVKTLAFMVKETPVLVLLAGSARIDNAKFRQTFHCKTKMMNEEQLFNFIGHPAGGVCPFGLKTQVSVYIDESIRPLDWVYPAAGTENTAVRMNVQELEKASQAVKWVNVSK